MLLLQSSLDVVTAMDAWEKIRMERESEGPNMHWTVPVYMVVTHNWAVLGRRGAQSHQSLLDGRECRKGVSGYLDAIVETS